MKTWLVFQEGFHVGTVKGLAAARKFVGRPVRKVGTELYLAQYLTESSDEGPAKHDIWVTTASSAKRNGFNE